MGGHESIAEQILRRQEVLEAHHDQLAEHDEQMAARDRAEEKAPLADWHPWRSCAPVAEHPALAERTSDPQLVSTEGPNR